MQLMYNMVQYRITKGVNEYACGINCQIRDKYGMV